MFKSGSPSKTGSPSRATTAVPALPAKLPLSALPTAIRDASVRRRLTEGAALRAKMAALRAALRGVLGEVDRCRLALQIPAEPTDYSDAAAGVAPTGLQARKDALHQRLSELRAAQDNILQARGDHRSAIFAVESIDADEADARKAAEAAIAESRAALARLDKGQSPAQRNEAFAVARKELAEVQAELATANKGRRARSQQQQQPESEELAGLWQRQSALRGCIEAVEAQLSALHGEDEEAAAPYRHFTYPAASKMEIVGRNGATLRQLQIDFGVAICIDTVPTGTGFVLGGAADVAACLGAIEQLTGAAAASSSAAAVATIETATETVHFDAALTPQVIGSRGATIAGFERESGGARLTMVRDGEVAISGPAAAVAAAKALLEALIDSLGYAELPFDATAMHLVIGKAGATIAAVERESGLRSLRADRRRGCLVATGTRAAIDRAFAAYRDLLGGAEGGTATIAADDHLIRAVLGPGGRNVRQLEAATGARIDCSSGGGKAIIKVTGPPAAVTAACAAVEGLRRAELTVEAVDASAMAFLTAPLVKSSSNSKSSGKLLSPLEAVRVATGCDQVAALRAEGVIVVRGRPELARRAEAMVRQLLLRNPLHSVRVTYPEALRRPLLHRRSDRRGPSSSLLDQLARGYSPFLRVDIDSDGGKGGSSSCTLTVSSQDAVEAKEAATEVAALVADLTARKLRVMDNFPAHLIGKLLGSGGATIRELSAESGTEVSLERGTGQVQIYSDNGDTAALDRAERLIRRNILGEAVDDDNEEVDEGTESGMAEGEADGVEATAAAAA